VSPCVGVWTGFFLSPRDRGMPATTTPQTTPAIGGSSRGRWLPAVAVPGAIQREDFPRRAGVAETHWWRDARRASGGSALVSVAAADDGSIASPNPCRRSSPVVRTSRKEWGRG
jgi:hypothetical protein